MGEFDFIARYFRPLAGKGSFELRNDGAVLSPPIGEELVISSDTMVENLHFLPDDPADTVAKKLLRCNLSDLAAMGARPAAYMLNVSVPSGAHYGEAWFALFSKGLAEDQEQYQLSLLGGDTTGSTGPLVLSLTIFGYAPIGKALRRDTAQPGDEIWVTGTLGDAVLGLYARKGKLEDPTGALVEAYRLPTPRTGLKLHGIVHAALDISDGLLQDCGHIARESGVAVELEAASIPFSQPVKTHLPQWQEECLIGGDDYELLIACSPTQSLALKKQCDQAHIPLTRIGHVVEGVGVNMRDENGHLMQFPRTGWQHF
ncbi:MULTISPECIES: thiamine-phosphate kinase [unclassified Saccharibacter]|uniref:thiamine-phosphate kinase n=1 Tax=unclassified Saccharibacter TaxID=2648722 RepID=UPI0019293C42|nr:MULTISPECIES: thiamine-phosphate kinase [unclassified Saccharibacter]